MKLTIDNALNVIRKMVECHFQTVESFNGRGEDYYLIDNNHETIDDFMEEMKDAFIAEFEED